MLIYTKSSSSSSQHQPDCKHLITSVPSPQFYCGDFQSPHTDWRHNNNSDDGYCLVRWANSYNLAIRYNPKDTASFHSGRWNTSTNLNLVFCRIGPDRLLPHRLVLEKFPRLLHRTSLITLTRLTLPVPGRPLKRWNFRRANWSKYISLTNQLVTKLPYPELPDVNEAYQNF